MGGQTAGLGDAWGRWDSGCGNGWEVAARGVGWVATAASNGLNVVDGLGTINGLRVTGGSGVLQKDLAKAKY